MAARPDLQKGYLGPQSKFEEFGLSTVTHQDPEINIDSNQVEVQIRVSKPTKVTANLTSCAKNEELPQHVFTQTKDGVVSVKVSLPEVGYYKLQIFALLLPDDSKTLPGVYNYLINCSRIASAVATYPKQFAQWKEGCYIVSPSNLDPNVSLAETKFEVFIPKVKSAAVVADGSWTHLNQNTAGLWEGTVNLDPYRFKDAKVTLNANYGDDNKFSTLLEYKV
ncbi:uncharacterized protein LOC123546900 [Mercenaria mercenaria]|uniref:uncharacterized protein LOC123546900 n=1 Tax=Mercenaria mercenaria TaxID=6596 RepID=UPI001E1D445F|nr:uncharacterized protein LOC123546900 [Mercenaria mercenaria]